MKKHVLLLLSLTMICYAQAIDTIHVVYPDDFQTNDDWKRNNKYHWIAQFDSPLYVIGCGTNAANTQVYLAHERYRVPEEIISGFEADSTQYDSITAAHRNDRILFTLDSNYMHNYDIRLGSTITNLVAEIAGQKKLKVWDSIGTMSGNIQFDNNRPTTLPDMHGARLLVCAQNVKNYFVYYNNPYAGPKTWTEMDCKLQKIASGLVHINADVYALCEVERSDAALDSLVNRMNRLVGKKQYAYVAESNDVRTMKNYPLKKDSSTYTRVCFIYNKSTCVPDNGTIGRPYLPSGNKESQRYSVLMEYVQFREVATGGKFILSMNHYRAKTGTLEDRMENSQQLIASLEANVGKAPFEDIDVLLIGDFNSYTNEKPCLYLLEHGYTDETIRFSPNDYSHAYENQVGYLDHAYSNASMGEQITWVCPYHVNTDEPKGSDYTQGDCSRFGYSDHDPILIGISLNETSTSIETLYPTAHINLHGQTAHITYPGKAQMYVYNLMGQPLMHRLFNNEVEVNLKEGAYVIEVNGNAQKVLVYPQR